MFLTELFKHSVPYDIVRDDKMATEYHFKLGETHYEVYVEQGALPSWQVTNLGADYGQRAALEIKDQPVLYVEFSTAQGPGGRDRYALTNRGNAALVFSAVINIINDALKKHPVKYLKFDAKETNRQSLYKRIAHRFGKQVYEVSRPADSRNVFGDRVFIVKL